MNLWSTIIFILFLIWAVICQQWYVCGIKKACDNTTEQVESPTAKNNKTYNLPIVFDYQSATPILNDTLFASYSSDLLTKKSENDQLVIEGQYYDGEEESIGTERAEALAQLLQSENPDLSIDFRTRKINQSKTSEDDAFEATQCFWENVEPVDTTAIAGIPGDGDGTPTAGDDGGDKDSKIEELADRIRINHEYNSTKRTVDPEVDSYLEKLVRRVSQTGEKIQLTGHTDNTGNTEYNQELGKKRAEFIKGLLIEKGVDAALISTASMGETKPVKDNDTDAGRAKNRRTELVLVRK